MCVRMIGGGALVRPWAFLLVLLCYQTDALAGLTDSLFKLLFPPHISLLSRYCTHTDHFNYIWCCVAVKGVWKWLPLITPPASYFCLRTKAHFQLLWRNTSCWRGVRDFAATMTLWSYHHNPTNFLNLIFQIEYVSSRAFLSGCPSRMLPQL